MKLKTVSGIMLTLLLTSISTLAFNIMPVTSAALDLVQNPGFEDELALWHVSMGTATYVADSLNPESGTYCAKGIELHEGSLGRLYQDMTSLVSPGGEYKISGWIRTQNVVGYVVIALNYVNEYGVTPADGYVKEIGHVTGTADWAYYESDVFTLPPMPSDASAIWFLFDFNAGKGTAWWDDVSLIEVAPPAYKVLVDEGHSEWLVSGNAQTLIQALEDKGYIVETFSGMLTQSLLNTYSVLVIGTAWGSFAQSEIQAIEDFVKNGGGLWLTGLGWSWVDYHPGSTIEDYPMNKIAQKFGAFFNPDIIFDPTDYTNVPASAIFHSPFIETHPATQGVNIVGATGAFHGSLSIQTGTILIAGDDDSYGGYHESPYPNPGSHPPNCAAIEYGAGKVIVVSQEGFFIDNFIDECDNKMLGLNIVDWLATPVMPATVDIDPDTLNLDSRGQWITAYIQLPEGYNAEDIDATTILLNGTISPILDPKYEFVTNSSEYLVDYNEDGLLERLVKFAKAEVISYILESLGFEPVAPTEIALTITGELYDRTPFDGSCVIRAMTSQKRKLEPTLTLIGPWSEAEMDAFMPVLQAFEEKTEIDIEYKICRAEDLATLLPDHFEAGTTPGDVIFMWSWFIEEKGQEGHILDVTDLVDETDFSKGTFDPVKVDDTLYGGAYTGRVKPGFWYRKSFFTANGLTEPTTWVEFLTLLDDIAAVPSIVNPILSGDGVGWPLSDVTEHFIATYGGPELHRNLMAGTVAWNSPQVKSIFADFLVPLLAGDFSDPKTWDTYIANWWNGEYGLYFMGSWITAMVDDPTDLGVFSLPEAPGAEGVVAHADYFFIPAYTEHPKEAKELFKFLASEEAQSIQVAQGGHVATNILVPLDVYPPVDRQVAEVVQGKEILRDLDDAIGGEFQWTFWDQLKLLWVSPTSLDDVLNAIEAVAP